MNRTFHVFAVRLDAAVMSKPTFKAKNPGCGPGQPCYFIGSSQHEPERAFKEHKSGEDASAWVREHGLYLSKARCFTIDAGNRAECEQAVVSYAAELRAAGCAVCHD